MSFQGSLQLEKYLNEVNGVELMDIDAKEFPKFKKEFDKVAKKMSGLKPEYHDGGGIYGPYGSMSIDSRDKFMNSSARKKEVIKSIEDTLKKLKIKSYDFRRNPG